MTFLKRLRFFGFGIILGSILSVIMFGPEKFSCSGYLPEGRVLAELQTKKWSNDSIISKELSHFNIDNEFIKDSILTLSSINFEESEPRKKPCSIYSVYYPKKNARFHFTISKCDSSAHIISAKKL